MKQNWKQIPYSREVADDAEICEEVKKRYQFLRNYFSGEEYQPLHYMHDLVISTSKTEGIFFAYNQLVQLYNSKNRNSRDDTNLEQYKRN